MTVKTYKEELLGLIRDLDQYEEEALVVAEHGLHHYEGFEGETVQLSNITLDEVKNHPNHLQFHRFYPENNSYGCKVTRKNAVLIKRSRKLSRI